MFKLISVFLTLSIFMWILPLGAFIKPSQEKTACGGNRGFHMCSMMEGGSIQKDNEPHKISFTNASGVEKTSKSDTSSGGNDFLLEDMRVKAANGKSVYLSMDLLVISLLFQRPIEHPPKISTF